MTCGSDGEVRVFEGLDDDDCKTHVVADCAYAVAARVSIGCFTVFFLGFFKVFKVCGVFLCFF